jgi:hypothetical protein
MRGAVRTTASVASTLPKANTNSCPPRFDNARATHSEFGRQPWNGGPTRSMAVTSEIIVFMKFDSTVPLPRRGHGIDVRIH